MLFNALENFEGSSSNRDLRSQFEDIAQAAFSGHFVINKGTDKEYGIYLYNIEFYYHDEGRDGIKDPVMYHQDANGYKGLDYSLGAIVPNPSGVDIAFENEAKNYRASFLIRGYVVLDRNASKIVEHNNDHPRYLWDDLFGYTDKASCGLPNIRWEDDVFPFTGEIQNDVRKNVFLKDDKGNNLLDENGNKKQDPRLWAYSRDVELLTKKLNDSVKRNK